MKGSTLSNISDKYCMISLKYKQNKRKQQKTKNTKLTDTEKRLAVVGGRGWVVGVGWNQ